MESKELFDVVDEKGQPTGEIVSREEAHKKGIRHRTAHVWIVRKRGDEIQVLLQKRSENKDSHPGCYDISSAGHIPAGTDYVVSALRELREELGVNAKPDDLRYCGQMAFQYEGEFHGQTFKDNQVSNIYLMWLNKPESEFVLQEDEVSEVHWFNLNECIRKVKKNKLPNCIHIEELELVRSMADRRTSSGIQYMLVSLLAGVGVGLIYGLFSGKLVSGLVFGFVIGIIMGLVVTIETGKAGRR